MRITSLKDTDELADELIKVGHFSSEKFYEIEHYDAKWIVALYVRTLAFRRALGFPPLEHNADPAA